MRFSRRSLGFKMVVMFATLLAGIGLFMFAFFPARMADQARGEAEQRAQVIAQVVATALGPALEFEDPDNAATILGWLEQHRDVEFGMVRDGTGKLVALHHAERVPARSSWGVAAAIEQVDNVMIVTVPIQALGGGHGTLHLGFSLEHLEAERDATRRTVALATLQVFAIGLLATMLLAALLVRPIHKLTRTALKISRGELPPQLPAIGGGAEIEQLATALRAMLERIHHESQQELMQASRHAGMAEVATGVLHNVGNVLTSVNISVELLRERAMAYPLERLRRLHELLSAPASQVADSERLAAAVRYIALVSDTLERGREDGMRHIEVLRGHVEHMKRVVAMQNSYARAASVVESARIPVLLDEATEIAIPATRRAAITIERELEPGLETETVRIDRHRTLQIVVNLLTNARDAVMASSGARRIIVRVERADQAIKIVIRDSGVGIARELLDRIFSAGFTSKQNGHGYGLHSSALAARQLGGALEVASEGESRGATFTLTVPIESSSC